MKNNKQFVLLAIVSIIVLSVSVSNSVFAADDCAILLSSFCDGNLGGLLSLIINILTGGVVVAGTIGIVWTGRIILTARDNQSEVERAKKRLIEIIIGLAVWSIAYVGASFFIPNFNGSIDNPNTDGLSFSGSDSPSLQDLSQIKPNYDTGGSSSTPSTPSNPSTPSTPSEPGTPVTPTSGQNSYGGMDYFLNVPQGATTNMPLMIWLHGSGETGQPSVVRNYYQTTNMFARNDFISLVPVAPSENWESGKLGTLKAIIDNVANQYGVNKNKIYIWGFSMGGRGTYYMLHTYPGFFKAAVVVSNCFYGGSSYANIAKTYVRAIRGEYETDDYGTCMQNDVNGINAAGGSASIEIYPGKVHSTISPALNYTEIFNWMLSK